VVPVNCRERVIATLNHKEPDRIPLDLGGTIVSSITKNAYISLKKYLGLETSEVKILDHVQQLSYIDEGLLQKLNVDIRMVSADYNSDNEPQYFKEGDYYCFYDRWGSKLCMPRKNGHYFDWVKFMINDISIKTLNKYRWPELDSDMFISKLKEKAKYLYENTAHALAGTAIFGGGVFEQPARIMSMERFLISIVLNEKFANMAMEKITELYIENCERYLNEIGKYIQVFVYWNDITGQTAPLISPDTYRRLIKPKDKRIIEMVKSRTDAKFFYHCCGASGEFIPDFIEIGLDILNPVQPKCMDPHYLKKRYGKNLSFWGTIDIQETLPFGTSEQIENEVRDRIKNMSPGRRIHNQSNP